MANGIDWFRWHHGSVNDPKFGLVAKKAKARVGDVIAIGALGLEQASASTERGQFSDIDCEATDFLLGAEDGTTARILEAMQGRGLISGDRVMIDQVYHAGLSRAAVARLAKQLSDTSQA